MYMWREGVAGMRGTPGSPPTPQYFEEETDDGRQPAAAADSQPPVVEESLEVSTKYEFVTLL